MTLTVAQTVYIQMTWLLNDSYERIRIHVVLASLEIRDLSGGIKKFLIQDSHSTEILSGRLQNTNYVEAPPREKQRAQLCRRQYAKALVRIDA
jgi:hypothetical protein